MRVAITGTTGYLGRFVVDSLLTAGHTVVAQIRNKLNPSDPLTQYGSGLELVEGNIDEIVSLTKLVQQCDAVVHMAFMSATGTYRGGEGNDPAWFWDQNFGGTLRLLDVCRQSKVAKFVFLSSRAVFDGCQITGRKVKDTDEPIPVNHYGLLKLASEKLAKLQDDITFCSIRPTGIYGLVWPRTRTKWWNLLSDPKLLESDLTRLSDTVYTEVHGMDVATAVLLLLQQPHSTVHGRAFNCSDLLVSEQFLLRHYQNLLLGGTRELNDVPLQAPANHMGTAGLNQLGWRGGGDSRFRQFLSDIKATLEECD